MALFTNNITSGSTMADVAAQFSTWAANMTQLTVADNFTGSFSANISNIVNGLSALGGTLSGNLACDSGILIDGQDVSELGDRVDVIKSVVDNDSLTKDDIIVIGGTGANGDDLYSVFTAAYPTYSTTTHNIYYSITGFQFTPLTSTDANYTVGNFSAYCNGSVIVMSGTDRNGLSILTSDLVAYYRILAIPK